MPATPELIQDMKQLVSDEENTLLAQGRRLVAAFPLTQADWIRLAQVCQRKKSTLEERAKVAVEFPEQDVPPGFNYTMLRILMRVPAEHRAELVGKSANWTVELLDVTVTEWLRANTALQAVGSVAKPKGRTVVSREVKGGMNLAGCLIKGTRVGDTITITVEGEIVSEIKTQELFDGWFAQFVVKGV